MSIIYTNAKGSRQRSVAALSPRGTPRIAARTGHRAVMSQRGAAEAVIRRSARATGTSVHAAERHPSPLPYRSVPAGMAARMARAASS